MTVATVFKMVAGAGVGALNCFVAIIIEQNLPQF